MADLCALTGGKPEFITLECVAEPVGARRPARGRFPLRGAGLVRAPAGGAGCRRRPHHPPPESGAGEQTYVVVQVLPMVKSHYYSNGQHY